MEQEQESEYDSGVLAVLKVLAVPLLMVIFGFSGNPILMVIALLWLARDSTN